MNFELTFDMMAQTVMADLVAFSSSSGQRMASGYGGDGKSVEPHSYAAIVTCGIRQNNRDQGGK